MNRVNTAYNRRDLAGYMATHDRDYVVTSVTGQQSDYFQVQAGIANGFARHHQGSLHYSIQSFSLNGDVAQGRVIEHFVMRQSVTQPKWTSVRNALEDILWKKSQGSWHMAATQMIRDVESFQRM